MNLPLKINVLFFDTIISYTDRNNYEISVKIYIYMVRPIPLLHISLRIRTVNSVLKKLINKSRKMQSQNGSVFFMILQ